MKKQWLAMGLAVLLMLSGCGSDVSPAVDVDPTPSTQPAPTRPLTSTVTVEDAYAGELTIGDEVYTYRVPKVTVDGEPMTALNEKIYAEMHDGVLVNQVFANEGETAWTRMTYMWGENETVVSVVMGMTDANTGRDTFLAYSALKETGEVITDPGVVAKDYGLTLEMMEAEIAAALEMEYVMTHQAKISEVGQELYDQKLEAMLTEMVWRAVPFVSSAGDLCAVADMASFGDADYYKILINVTGGTNVTF